MLRLESVGTNGSKRFYLIYDEEKISGHLDELAQHIVSEYPDVAEGIISDYRTEQPLREIILEVGSRDQIDFLNYLTEAYQAEHNEAFQPAD